MLLRAWFRLFPFFCNPASLFSLQYHLVCHDQQAQHPVPLRPITPDPAMLCCQGAAQSNIVIPALDDLFQSLSVEVL